jgi:hypothetical protein
MCGIAGFLDLRRPFSNQDARELARAMADRLTHGIRMPAESRPMRRPGSPSAKGGVASLLADGKGATPYQPLEDKYLAAASGRIVQERGRSATHIPFWGD